MDGYDMTTHFNSRLSAKSADGRRAGSLTNRPDLSISRFLDGGVVVRQRVVNCGQVVQRWERARDEEEEGRNRQTKQAQTKTDKNHPLQNNKAKKPTMTTTTNL